MTMSIADDLALNLLPIHEIILALKIMKSLPNNEYIVYFIFSVFGLGTLIFTGLEIAMHATMEKNCVENILIAHPILQALFTFLQMHFLFVNSQVS